MPWLPIRGFTPAAPLKHRSSHTPYRVGTTIRGFTPAAPLKRRLRVRCGFGRSIHPRVHTRGPIEAMEIPSAFASIVAHPRVHTRGPIEAFLSRTCTHDLLITLCCLLTCTAGRIRTHQSTPFDSIRRSREPLRTKGVFQSKKVAKFPLILLNGGIHSKS